MRPPLEGVGPELGIPADKVQQPTMPSLQLATRARIQDEGLRECPVDPRDVLAGVPLADIHAAASCISRTTSSISPEQATRTFGGSSLSIRSGAV